MTDKPNDSNTQDPIEAEFSETPRAEPRAPADSALPVWLTSLPDRFRPYAALARLDRPIGTWLVLLPTLVALAYT
ncbi:MAG: 4-hydroxybenzoate octaprenyltransferase, partial [Henriciella sp.]